jgi:hypothetical protein
MLQVKIIKDYKMMKIGDTPIVDDAYAAILITKGVAEKPKVEAKK